MKTHKNIAYSQYYFTNIIIFLFVITLVLYSSVSLAAKKQLRKKTKSFSKHGVIFTYHRGWRLVKNKKTFNNHIIVIRTRRRASIAVFIYPDKKANRLVEFVRAYNKRIRKKMRKGKVSKSIYEDTQRNIPASKGAQGVIEKYSIKLRGREVPYVREYQRVPGKGKVAYIITTSRERTLKNNTAGFNTLFNSFRFK